MWSRCSRSWLLMVWCGGSLSPVLAAEPFLRGDVDRDGRLGMTDVVRILRAVIDRRALPCPDAADFSDNGLVQLGDAALLLEYLLKGSPDPKPPAVGAGAD